MFPRPGFLPAPRAVALAAAEAGTVPLFQGLRAPEVAEEERQPPSMGEENPNRGHPTRPPPPGVTPGAEGTPDRSTTPAARPHSPQRQRNRRRGGGKREPAAMLAARPASRARAVPELGGRGAAPGARRVPPRGWRREVLEEGCRAEDAESPPGPGGGSEPSSRRDSGLRSCGRSALAVSERRGRARAGRGPGGTIRGSGSRAAAPAAGPGPASRAAAPAAAPACYTGDTPSAPPAT